jgi:hypothetical protein
VIEIRVPHTEDGGLAGALAARWPSFGAYVVNFAVIGIMWSVITGSSSSWRRSTGRSWHLLSPSPDSNVAAGSTAPTASRKAIGFNVIWRFVVRDEKLMHPHLDVNALRPAPPKLSPD